MNAVFSHFYSVLRSETFVSYKLFRIVSEAVSKAYPNCFIGNKCDIKKICVED